MWLREDAKTFFHVLKSMLKNNFVSECRHRMRYYIRHRSIKNKILYLQAAKQPSRIIMTFC